MSERALALGIVKTLRDATGDVDGIYVGYRRHLKPIPMVGEFFFSVGKISSTRGPTLSGDVNDRVYTAQLCLTCRYSYAPEDRQDLEMSDELTDDEWTLSQIAERRPKILDLIDRACGLLIESYAVVNNCNTFITGFNTTTNGFIEPAHQMVIGEVEPRPPAWVGGDGPDTAGSIESVTATISGWRRIRVRGTN